MVNCAFGGTTFRAIEVEGSLVLSDLEGSGSPGDLLAVIRAVQEVSKGCPVYLTVDMDNPRKDELMRFYKRFGAKEKAILMEVI